MHKIKIKVLNSVPYEDFADLSDKETAEMVRERMIKQFELIKHHMGISE